MKIKNLIKALEDLLNAHGDLPVFVSANGFSTEASDAVFAKTGELPGHCGLGGESDAPCDRVVITIKGLSS